MPPMSHTNTPAQDLSIFSTWISRQAPEVMKSDDTIHRVIEIYKKAIGEGDIIVEKDCRDTLQMLCPKESKND